MGYIFIGISPIKMWKVPNLSKKCKLKKEKRNANRNNKEVLLLDYQIGRSYMLIWYGEPDTYIVSEDISWFYLSGGIFTISIKSLKTCFILGAPG